MIVRINQFDPANAEPYSGWGDEGLRGAIFYEWPEPTHAFEVLILESDERQRQLAPSFRQSQLRRLLPEILTALSEPGEQIVARLDGPVAPGELLGLGRHLTDSQGRGRFACSATRRLDPDSPAPMGSVRIQLTPQRLSALCMDSNAGLDSGVRMRLFVVPESLVNVVLEIDELDDERWGEVLPHVGLMIGSMRTMQSIYLLTQRVDAGQARQRIMRRLLGQPDARAV